MSQLSRHEISAEAYERVQNSPEFGNLRKRFRGFAFPMTVVFLVWYLVFVLMSAFAVDFMSTSVIGNVNVGLIFGLLQFVSTFLITTLYVRHANKNTDPIADALRDQLVSGAAGTSGTPGVSTKKGATRG